MVLLCLVEEFGESDKFKSFFGEVIQYLWDCLGSMGFDIVAKDDFAGVWSEADVFVDDFGVSRSSIGGGDSPVETCPFSGQSIFVEV